MPITKGAESELRIKFFDSLFADTEGFLCIATKNPATPSAGFVQKFFRWPDDSIKAEEFIIRSKPNRDVYFCVNLLNKAERKKEFCMPTDLIWSDLDEADVMKFGHMPPAIVIESSPGRHQAIWRISLTVDPRMAENYSKRIAYKFGADKSGWDLTQLLRVPQTFNYKYTPPAVVGLPINLPREISLPPLVFEGLPNPDQDEEDELNALSGDLPDLSNLPDVANIIYKYTAALRGTDFTALYSREVSPDDDWSKPLWKLIHTCLEMGMEPEEVFVVIRNSPLDKYERDQRPPQHLWREICKAKRSQDNITVITANFKPVVMPDLVDLDQQPDDTFVTQYREWAELSTDAVPEFHDLSAFMLLSSIVANSIRVPTSYAPDGMVPNLWGMILGDSTLTRKTTAMRMVMDILNTLEPESILATDGSAEGLLSGLELRPNKTSIFFRDELSGFFDSINRKDYLAGMSETLTHLYDVPTVYQRRLRKEIIRLENPIFIFFGGGVRDKIYEVLTEEYILSGFIPRFLVVSGDADLSKLRRTGPAEGIGLEKRAKIVTWSADLYEKYAAEVTVKIGGEALNLPPRITAQLSSEAWSAYGDIEEKMVDSGAKSSIPHLALPTFERLSRSCLKMAVILAAARQEPKDNFIQVSEKDVMNAAWYIQQWGQFSIDLIMNTGKGITEKIMDKILRSIKKNPGMLRSTIMQHHHLTARQADEIFKTLEERMIVHSQKKGRGVGYWAV